MKVHGKVHRNFHVSLHALCMKVHGKGISKCPCTLIIAYVA